jgi:hypothetical protein
MIGNLVQMKGTTLFRSMSMSNDDLEFRPIMSDDRRAAPIGPAIIVSATKELNANSQALFIVTTSAMGWVWSESVRTTAILLTR